MPDLRNATRTELILFECFQRVIEEIGLEAFKRTSLCPLSSQTEQVTNQKLAA